MDNAQDSVKEGYEVTDMNVTIISYFLAGLFVLMFGSVGAIVMVLRGFDESRPALNQEPVSPLATAGIQVPDGPLLQMDPVSDRKAIEAKDVAHVTSYGIVSEDHGMARAHIPVDIAMERMAAGKGTYRQAPTAAQVSSTEQ
jgi:hypothetical protein